LYVKQSGKWEVGTEIKWGTNLRYANDFTALLDAPSTLWQWTIPYSEHGLMIATNTRLQSYFLDVENSLQDNLRTLKAGQDTINEQKNQFRRYLRLMTL
jgi:hypothetical protein